mgnify:CR=1 FL=1
MKEKQEWNKEKKNENEIIRGMRMGWKKNNGRRRMRRK